jgi:hypothetical protein
MLSVYAYTKVMPLSRAFCISLFGFNLPFLCELSTHFCRRNSDNKIRTNFHRKILFSNFRRFVFRDFRIRSDWDRRSGKEATVDFRWKKIIQLVRGRILGKGMC